MPYIRMFGYMYVFAYIVTIFCIEFKVIIIKKFALQYGALLITYININVVYIVNGQLQCR